LCIHVADSTYSAVNHLGRVGRHRNLVSVTRVAENRVFYRQFPAEHENRGQGHPRWYGERFDLKDSTTWGPPDETVETPFTTKRGCICRLQMQGWHNLLMRGKRDLPMHRYPFTLIRAVVLDEQGQPVFKRILWLIVLGERRAELTLVEAWEAYGQRYDLETFFSDQKSRGFHLHKSHLDDPARLARLMIAACLAYSGSSTWAPWPIWKAGLA
jgi:hypothetical protein